MSFGYLTHMYKVTHSTCMDSYLVGLDALILAGLNLYLRSFYVCASSEGPHNAASKRRHVLEMTDQIFN